MQLHPIHPAAWVLDTVRRRWQVHDLLSFTRSSTLILVSVAGEPPVVLKAGFGSNHVLADLDDDARRMAYGFYWYQEMSPAERALSREDFRHEASMLETASGGTNIVPLLERGSGEHFDWYTMPYLEQGNFRPWVLNAASGKDFDTSRAVGLLADVADGLAALHSRGIVHRDVYQENILIHNDTAMITDLGAARYAATRRGPAQRGPEVHWPPEYATDYDTAGPGADIFSLGVLTYRVVCGDIPRFQSNDRLSNAPTPLRDALAAALAHDPAARPSIDEFGAALRVASKQAA
jgi:serine/threonine protein kinase